MQDLDVQALVEVAVGNRECDTHELAKVLLSLPAVRLRRPGDERDSAAWSEELAEEAGVQVAVRAW